MATENRPADDLLIERIVEKPWAFDFFQAIRRLECAHPAQPPIGRSTRLAEDPVRFGQEPSLAFAPSTIARCEVSPVGVLRMLVHCFGLLGPNGPMPLLFTEHVAWRQRIERTGAAARFLDVFHHRMISLFYRAWASTQMTVSRDRPDRDRFAAYTGSLLGMGTEALIDRDAVADDAKRFYAGWLSSPARSADGLCAILADDFGLRVRIVEFIGRWIVLPAHERLALGGSPKTAALGSTAIVGERLWSAQQKLRIVLGPLGLADYERFLPGGRSHARLSAWVRQHTSGELEAEVQMVLRAGEVPPVVLGSQGRLGWTTWLASEPFAGDADDLVLQAVAA